MDSFRGEGEQDHAKPGRENSDYFSCVNSHTTEPS